MRLFDTHIHLDAEAFRNDWQHVWSRAIQAGVHYAANAGAFPENWELSLDLAQQLPRFLPCIGIHPMIAHTATKDILHQMKMLLASKKFFAISEIGLDPLFPESPLLKQEIIFRNQIEFSLEYRLPICLHIRRTHDLILKILDEYDQPKWSGIAHCFSGSLEQALEFIKRGFLISFAGPVTNSNAGKLHRIAQTISLDKIVVETDSPDLPPRNLKTERNEPAFLVEIVKMIALLRITDLTKISEQIYQNSCQFFGVPLE